MCRAHVLACMFAVRGSAGRVISLDLWLNGLCFPGSFVQYILVPPSKECNWSWQFPLKHFHAVEVLVL